MGINESLNYKLSLQDLFSGKLKGIEDSVGRLDSKMNGLNKTASGLAGGLAAYFSISAIKQFGSAVIDSLKNYEYFSASLRTLLHGDANAANLLNARLVQLAKVSPFSLVDVQDSSKKLLAYGFAAKDVVGTMKMLGDVSSATGNNIGDVAYLYGTLRTQGVAMTKDLREFTNRGINLIPLLAKQFKIAEKDVYQFASESKIGFKNVERAFQEMTSKGGDFFNMMEEQSKTVGGRISNLGDAWEQLKITIGKSQTGILNSTVRWATDMVNALNNMWMNQDKIAASFQKYGAQDYTWLQKFNKFIGAGAFGSAGDATTGGQMSNLRYQDALNKMYVNPSSESLSQAIKSQASLSNILVNLYKDKEARKDITQFQRTVAIVKGSLDEVKSNISALKSPGFLDTTGKGKNASLEDAAKSSSTEISGSKPQNTYITIQKLVETFNVYANNVKDASKQVVDVLTPALLEVVNDVNDVAR